MSARGRFDGGSIERVREATDIVAVVGRFVDLKRSGSSMKGLCPFHREKTPSFHVSRERQAYHCFGCGAGGDVFSFMMEYLSMTFPEAVEELAAEAGIELERTASGGERSRTDPLLGLLAEAQAFFRMRLESAEGAVAREYLAGRGLTGQTIEELGVGWAPGGDAVCREMTSRGFSGSQLTESGLGLSSDRGDGSLFDRFRRRITFPIRDRKGRVLSFGGRLLDDDAKAPKYMNGPDSPVYRKGDTLYGYREAVRSARDFDMIVLVEGYFDHARFHQAGFPCSCATCGTALTPVQARRLSVPGVDVVVCYDGDRAGQRAAVRAAEVLLEQGVLPRIARVPDGMDPDDYVVSEGQDAVMRLARGAMDPVRFALSLLGGWQGVNGTSRRVRVMRRLVDIAGRSSDPLVREELKRVISEETGYGLDSLEVGMREAERRGSGRTIRSAPVEAPARDRSILAVLLTSPEGLGDPLLDFLEPEDLRSDSARELLDCLSRQRSEGMDRPEPAAMEETSRSLFGRIMTESTEDAYMSREAVMSRIGLERLRRERSLLERELSGAAPERAREILRRKAELDRAILGASHGGRGEG